MIGSVVMHGNLFNSRLFMQIPFSVNFAETTSPKTTTESACYHRDDWKNTRTIIFTPYVQILNQSIHIMTKVPDTHVSR